MTWEGLNRRKFPRATFPCLVKIVNEGELSEIFLVHTENISACGVCVIIRKPMEMFSPLILEIDLMDGGENILCRGKVVWVVRRKATEQVKPSCYDTGIEFSNINDSDRARIDCVVDYLLRGHKKAKI